MPEQLPEIAPENYFRRVWHTNCPQWGLSSDPPPHRPPSPPRTRTSGVMLEHRKYETQIEDGSTLVLCECLHCGEMVYAGIDQQRYIVRAPVPESVEQEIREASREAKHA